MTPQEVLSIAEDTEEVLLLEPREAYDQCLVGIVQRFNSTFVVYSKRCVLKHLTDEADDDDEDPEVSALEHFQFNIVGGWVGDGTPAFLLDEEAS